METRAIPRLALSESSYRICGLRLMPPTRGVKENVGVLSRKSTRIGRGTRLPDLVGRLEFFGETEETSHEAQ
jgi:hypothetical protein